MYEKLKQDDLPADAWIGFLDANIPGKSTRTNTRPFNLEEQQKILKVGACLTCHKDNSKIMQQVLLDFDKIMNMLSDKCISPRF